ncbi:MULTISPECIES: VWA domain-containing protein [unclassified Blastococcus]
MAVLGAALVGVVAVAGPSAAAPSGTGTEALQQLGGCLTSSHHLDVLLLVDQSSSLRTSDPEGARVTAAQLLLARLADTAERTGSTVDLAVEGFDATVQVTTAWTSLTGDTLPAAQQQIAEFAERDNGVDTDYWTALGTARQHLVDHKSSDDANPCQALVLFTDGKFDLTVRDTPELQEQYGTTKPIPGAEDVDITTPEGVDAVVAAGEADLCRSGGIADAIRSDGILLIALGLNANGAQDLSFLAGIAEGFPQSCGAQPPYGYFIAANDVGDLVLAFDAVGDPGNPPLPPTEMGVCPGRVCAQQAHTFTLDSSIQGIHVAGTSSARGIDVYVQPPGTDPVGLRYDAASPAGSTAAGDVTLDYTWYADGAFSIDAQAPASGDNWSGTWRVVFVDRTGQNPEAVSKMQLTIQADLQAALAPAPPLEWRAGESVGPAFFELVRADGTPAILGDPAPTLALDVFLRPSTGADVPLAGGLTLQQMQAGVALPVPPDFPAGGAQLVTRLHVTTVSGLVLDPQVRSQPITVAAAFGFPAPTGSVDFGTVAGLDATSGQLSIEGRGCVWVSDGGAVSLQTQPADIEAGDLSVSGGSPSDEAPTCSDKPVWSVPVELASGRSAAGNVTGLFTVHLAPVDADGAAVTDREVTAQVPFTATLERVANGSVLWLAFAVALLVGIGLPALVLLLGRRLAARFPARPLQSALLDVLVGPSGVRMAGGGALAAPERWDVVAPPTSGRRRARLSGVPVRARAGTRLSDAGFAEPEEEHRVGVSGAPGSRSSRTLRPRLPLALQGSWTLLLDRVRAGSDAAEVPAQLLLVTDSASTAQQREDLVARARDEAPAAVDSLRDAARAQQPDGADGGQTSTPDAAERSLSTDDPFGPHPVSSPEPGSAPATRRNADPFARADSRATDPFALGGSPAPAAFPVPDPRPGSDDRRSTPQVDDPFSR